MAAMGSEFVFLSQFKEYKEYMDNKLYPVNSLFLCADDTNPASVYGEYGSASKRGFCTPPLLIRLERSPLAQMAWLLVRPRGLRLELRCGSESHRRNINRGGCKIWLQMAANLSRYLN